MNWHHHSFGKPLAEEIYVLLRGNHPKQNSIAAFADNTYKGVLPYLTGSAPPMTHPPEQLPRANHAEIFL